MRGVVYILPKVQDLFAVVRYCIEVVQRLGRIHVFSTSSLVLASKTISCRHMQQETSFIENLTFPSDLIGADDRVDLCTEVGEWIIV